MLRAMMWGRPLPPRLARAAVQDAPKLQKDAWRGWLFLGIGVAFVGLSIAEADTSRIHWWVPIGYVAVAAGWMWSGGQMLLTARQARRAVRDRYWPERPDPPA